MLNQVSEAGWRLNGSYGYNELENLADTSKLDIYHHWLKTQGAFQAWVNDTTGEATLAFKGSVQAADWFDDLNPISQGAFTYETVREQALRMATDMQNNGYNILTTGHSLGGAQSQSFALEFGAPSYVFDSLPISSSLLSELSYNNDLTTSELIADYNANYDSMRILTNGEIATSFYDAFLNRSYLNNDPIVMQSGLETNSVAASIGLTLLFAAVPFNFSLPVAVGMGGLQHPLGAMDIGSQRPVSAGGGGAGWWTIDSSGVPVLAP